MLLTHRLRRAGQLVFVALLLSSLVGHTRAVAQTTNFTYQGKLTDSGAPINALYDFIVRLWDAPTNGNQIGSALVIQSTAVVDGIFTVTLDFGAGAFNGDTRFLEISLKPTGNPGVLPTLLSPRQQVLSTPYAIKSLGSASADGLSAACVNCINSSQIGSVNGSAITGSINGNTISGTIPVGSVPPGSSNYIQNTASQQAASNFNISGNGTAGGTLAGNIVSASTQYNLGAFRILTFGPNAGDFNLFAGVNAGQANTGFANTFFGQNAGLSNTSGGDNSFFGASAGQNHTTGTNNSFFGYRSGFNNTEGGANTFVGQFAGVSNSTGSINLFVGSNAGVNNTTGNGNVFIGGMTNNLFNLNTTGSFNTSLGTNAGLLADNLSHATAIGAEARVSNSNTIALGRPGGEDAVVIYGNGTVGGVLSGNFVNAGTYFSLGGPRILSNPGINNLFVGVNTGVNNSTGANNSFLGDDAGRFNTTGSNNSFFGGSAGLANNTGSLNSFFGTNAGQGNQSGGNNSFFGFNAGFTNNSNNNSFFGSGAGRNNTGFNNSYFGKDVGFAAGATHDNAFFGYLAGFANNNGNNNSFFGSNAGVSNTFGATNSFFGFEAGKNNINGNFNVFLGSQAGVVSDANNNVFVGDSAGRNNTTGGSNTFVGKNAGNFNITGSKNTIIGDDADVVGDNLINANAIGYQAAVAQNNSLVLGSINGINGATADTKVGIGTTTPSEPLTIQTQGNNTNGVFGWSQTNGDIVFGSKVGGQGAQPYGGWIGTKTDHDLSFFVNNGTASFTLQRDRYLHFGNLNFGVNGSNLCLDGNSKLSICSSSLRYKTDVQSFTGGLDIVNRLRPIAFTWKEGGTRDIGFGAEEVDKVEPLLSFRNKEGQIEGVKYSQISAVLVNAVKEQQAQIKSQQEQLSRQQGEIALLKRLVYRRFSNTAARRTSTKRSSR